MRTIGSPIAMSSARRWRRRGWPVEFAVHRLASRPMKGESVEAWARRERYHALRTMALGHGASLVVLAHHQRDQAETFLLQALRGAGVGGLSGMPSEVHRDGLTWARPWLNVPREQIERYARRHRLRFVDDDSNEHPRFARNRLRLAVWPALVASFPDAQTTLAAAARWAQEARCCLDEIAVADLATLAASDALDLRAWRLLSPARRSNALRMWLRRMLGHGVPATLCERLMAELTPEGTATWQVDAVVLRAYRGALRIDFEAGKRSEESRERERETVLSIRRAGRYRLPGWGGELVARRVAQGGVPLAWLAHLTLSARHGGEQFQAGIGRPPRSLKKQFQAAAVPSWQRDGPIVSSGGQLIFVPGLGIDARAMALPGQAQVSLHWERATTA